jgi:hypothetical protein
VCFYFIYTSCVKHCHLKTNRERYHSKCNKGNYLFQLNVHFLMFLERFFIVRSTCFGHHSVSIIRSTTVVYAAIGFWFWCVYSVRCFGSSLPSSGSLLDPSELLEIQIGWVVYHIMCGYVACVPEWRGSTHSICISSKSEGSKKLPDDGRLLPKQVGDSIQNKGVVQISA